MLFISFYVLVRVWGWVAQRRSCYFTSDGAFGSFWSAGTLSSAKTGILQWAWRLLLLYRKGETVSTSARGHVVTFPFRDTPTGHAELWTTKDIEQDSLKALHEYSTVSHLWKVKDAVEYTGSWSSKEFYRPTLHSNVFHIWGLCGTHLDLMVCQYKYYYLVACCNFRLPTAELSVCLSIRSVQLQVLKCQFYKTFSG